MTDPTIDLDLNLEETGMLCHLLLEHLMRTNYAEPGPLGADMKPFGARMTTLYTKLSTANDLLIRKEFDNLRAAGHVKIK